MNWRNLFIFILASTAFANATAQTTIRFSRPESARVSLKIYDVTGRQVATLVNGWREPGHHDVTFDGSNLASGVYIYSLKAAGYSASAKMILLK